MVRTIHSHECGDTAYQAAAIPDECTCSAAWTPELGWHNVAEVERAELQREAVARITRRPRWIGEQSAYVRGTGGAA